MTTLLSSLSSQTPVLEILNRLRKYNIQLNNYVSDVDGDPWKDVPIGFHFFCHSVSDFKRDLRNNPGFGIAWWRTDLVKDAEVFREVSKDGSLHIILSNLPGDRCNIHLDSISIVAGVDIPSKKIIYSRNMSTILKHVGTDLLHVEDVGGILM
jgi:hypothetical protein